MNTDMDGLGRAIEIIAHEIAHNPPQPFSEIFYPDGTCGVVDGLRDCLQPGVVLGTDPHEPEPKTATWFCSKHWPEFENLYNIVEDKRTTEQRGERP